jgi:hypothetical protein
MRATHLILLAWAAVGGTAVAQDSGNAASSSSEKVKPAPIHFDLTAPKPAKPESLPTAATLGELTYANENKTAANPVPKAAPKAAPKVTTKVTAKPAPKLAAKAVAKPAPRPAPKVVAAKPAKVPWMSEWRRAYIAKHGHQPPVPAR